MTTYYGTNQASTTFNNADTLTTTGGGSSTVYSTGTATNNFTGFYLPIALKNGGAVTAYGSLPAAPLNFGWLFDNTSLEGTTMGSGTWTGTVVLQATAAQTVQCVVRGFRYNTNTLAYTQIFSWTGSNVAMSANTDATFSMPSQSVSSQTFATNEKLYIEVLVYLVSGGTAASTTSAKQASGTSGVASVAEFDFAPLQRQVPTSAALFGPSVRAVPASAVLKGTPTRPVPASAALFGPIFRTVPTSAIVGGIARPVPASAALGTVRAVPTSAALWGRIPAMPIISQGVPAYGTANGSAPGQANSADYGHNWRSIDIPQANSPVYVAYDLSGVPSVQRGNVVAAWYNEIGNQYWSNGNQNAVGLPASYVLEANAAAGGTYPTSGWTTLVTVTANVNTSRAHPLNLTGYNWLRLSVTMVSGQQFNEDAILQKFDVYDAHLAAQDWWFFFGDSITNESMLHKNLDGTAWNYGGALSQKVNALVGPAKNYYPLTIDGGHSGMTMAWAAANKEAVFANVGAKYVYLAFGTNDTNQPSAWSAGDANVQAVYANLLTVIDYASALAQRPTVIVPYIPWGSANGGNYANNANLVNQYVDAHLPTDRPAVVRGENFYALFQANPTLIRDGIHPTYLESSGQPSGYELYQQTRAQFMAALAYGTDTRQVPTSTAIYYPIRPVPASANLGNTRFVPATAALQATVARPVPSSAVLVSLGLSRPVPSSTVLFFTSTRTVPSSAALLLRGTRSLATAAVLGPTSDRAYQTFVVLRASDVGHYKKII